MGDIYSAADSVLVWLGSCPSLLSSGTERLEAFKGNLHGLLAAEYQSGPTASQKELDPALIALVTATYLITRRWFKRLWVLQEFCLARRLSFRFGEHRVDSETVTGIIASVSRWQFPKKFSGVNRKSSLHMAKRAIGINIAFRLDQHDGTTREVHTHSL